MKFITKLLIASSVFILILFLWKELPDLSIHKKINADKVSAFFSAIASLLTAVTVYLLYKQIQEQIKDRKAASKPDLYPENQFFSMTLRPIMPELKRENKQDSLYGLINLHNIGLGAAKEIVATWHFNKDILATLISSDMVTLYSNRHTEFNYSFVSPNNIIEIQTPLMYLASLASFKEGWSEVTWEELFLELAYKDVHDNQYPGKKFKVKVSVGRHYAYFRFTPTTTIELKTSSTIRSTWLPNEKTEL